MLKILCAGCLGLFSGILLQFTLGMCAAAQSCKKFLKIFFLGLKVVKVIDVNKIKKPVTSACYDEQHVCTHLPLPDRFHTRRANSCKITSF